MPPNGASGSSQDRYNLEVTDWSEIPTWRQTSFFGLRARGQFFVFVVDQSGSMIDDDRLIRAKIELAADRLLASAAATLRGHLLQ